MQVVFRYWTVPVEIVWDKMVLFLKGKGGYRGIGLVEVLWKVCAVVVNCRLEISVVLQDALCRFITGRWTGTAALEANMAQHLAGLAHKPLFHLFLDVWNAYDSLDRERCLELLRGYGMGPNLARLLENYWRRHRIFPKVGKYLGAAFGTWIRVTQLYPFSPIIFNVVVDAVVRAVLEEVYSPQEVQHGTAWDGRQGRGILFLMRKAEV